MTREQWANYLKPWVKGYGDGNEINAMALADNILAAIDREHEREVVISEGKISLIRVEGDGIDVVRALKFKCGQVIFREAK